VTNAERHALIAAEVERRGWHPHLSEWIDNLCTGKEDPTRMRCCHSGCHVCKGEVLRLVGLIKQQGGESAGDQPACDSPRQS
jgi:hypothetical protein